jgi:hypothetical protein
MKIVGKQSVVVTWFGRFRAGFRKHPEMRTRASHRYALVANQPIVLPWSLFRSDEIGTGLWSFVLTRFLHANRYPLRLKTLLRGSDRDRTKAKRSHLA